MGTARVSARRTVLIDRAPPRRVLAPLRYRAFKTGPDRAIWDACWEPVRRLLDAGWRIAQVTIDWGQALPMTTRWRVETVRDLTGCYDGCEVHETFGDVGRGQVVVEMTRD